MEVHRDLLQFTYIREYEEIFPLEIPTNVTVAGLDLRNTIIKPNYSNKHK